MMNYEESAHPSPTIQSLKQLRSVFTKIIVSQNGLHVHNITSRCTSICPVLFLLDLTCKLSKVKTSLYTATFVILDALILRADCTHCSNKASILKSNQTKEDLTQVGLKETALVITRFKDCPWSFDFGVKL